MRKEGSCKGKGAVYSRTEKESDRIEDVAQNELQRELADAESTADPGKKAVDRRDRRQDGDNIAENLPYQDDIEDGALGESVERIHGGILGIDLTTIKNNTTPRDRFLQLQNPELAVSDRSRYTHHRGGDEASLRINTFSSMENLPDVITRRISDSVIKSTYGLIKKADSS
jgi:hypothetical protein